MGLKLDHIAVAVSDLKAAITEFETLLGLSVERTEHVPTEGADVAFFDLGGHHLELVAPAAADSAIARSIAKRGEGLHHLCFEVPDIEKALETLRAQGMRLVNEKPVPGAKGSRVAFVHPKGLRGVLVELVEKARPAC